MDSERHWSTFGAAFPQGATLKSSTSVGKAGGGPDECADCAFLGWNWPAEGPVTLKVHSSTETEETPQWNLAFLKVQPSEWEEASSATKRGTGSPGAKTWSQ